MSKIYTQFGLLIALAFIISSSSSTSVQTETDALYVVQLTSSQKIWTDSEFKSIFNRFKSLESYGFVYESSYLDPNGIQHSRLYLGTYEDKKTAQKISTIVNKKLGIGSYVKPIKKRPKLKGTPTIINKIQKGTLSNAAKYQAIEQKGGTGTVTIQSSSKPNEYFFNFQTYDNGLLNNVQNNTTKPNNKPITTIKPKNETQPNTTLVGKDKRHIVKKGDTLSKLAQLYGLSIKELKKLNQLEDNTIKIGQRLIVKK